MFTASTLRSVTEMVRQEKRNALLYKILRDCTERAAWGKDYSYFDIEDKDASQDDMGFVMMSLKDLSFKVECKHVEDGYFDLTVRW